MNAAFALASFMLTVLTQSPARDLAAIARWLPGTYDTFAQASADEARGAAYKHVPAVLRVTPVRLAGVAADGRAFYLEQALAGHEGEPYRQRVIVLKRLDGAIMNELYRLRNAQSFVGFDGRRSLSLPELEREPGCDARWERESDSAFRGFAGTENRCPSTLRGATYAVSAFVLTRNAFTTLDQGVDDSGAIRWGPPVGEKGHVFLKRR